MYTKKDFFTWDTFKDGRCTVECSTIEEAETFIKKYCEIDNRCRNEHISIPQSFPIVYISNKAGVLTIGNYTTHEVIYKFNEIIHELGIYYTSISRDIAHDFIVKFAKVYMSSSTEERDILNRVMTTPLIDEATLERIIKEDSIFIIK